MGLSLNKMERWLPAKGYEGRYFVSNHGRVKTLVFPGPNKNKRRKIPKLMALGWCTNYIKIGLSDGTGNRDTVLLHVLVYKTFVGPIPKGFEIDHIDSNTRNNYESNLNAVTHKNNIELRGARGRTSRGKRHSLTLTYHPQPGSKNALAKLTEKDIPVIRSLARPNGRLTRRSIAELYGVSSSAIDFVVNRETWRHIA